MPQCKPNPFSPTTPCEIWHNSWFFFKAILFSQCLKHRFVCVCVHECVCVGWGQGYHFYQGAGSSCPLACQWGASESSYRKGNNWTENCCVQFPNRSQRSCLWPDLGPAQPKPWRISTSTTPTRRRLWRTATPRRLIWSTETPSKSMRTWWRFVHKGGK